MLSCKRLSYCYPIKLYIVVELMCDFHNNYFKNKYGKIYIYIYIYIYNLNIKYFILSICQN